MFVQSARFVLEHKANPGSEISVYGQQGVAETVRLGKMNLAVHGLAGDIHQGNTYYEDLHSSPGQKATGRWSDPNGFRPVGWAAGWMPLVFRAPR